MSCNSRVPGRPLPAHSTVWSASRAAIAAPLGPNPVNMTPNEAVAGPAAPVLVRSLGRITAMPIRPGSVPWPTSPPTGSKGASGCQPPGAARTVRRARSGLVSDSHRSRSAMSSRPIGTAVTGTSAADPASARWSPASSTGLPSDIWANSAGGSPSRSTRSGPAKAPSIRTNPQRHADVFTHSSPARSSATDSWIPRTDSGSTR